MPAEGLHAALGQIWVCLLGRSSRVLGMGLGLVNCEVALVVRVRKEVRGIAGVSGRPWNLDQYRWTSIKAEALRCTEGETAHTGPQRTEEQARMQGSPWKAIRR